TLDAGFNVNIKAQIVVQGAGGVAVIVNGAGNGDGDLRFFPGGKIDFWDTDASFSLNGQTHKLVNDIAAIASAYEKHNDAVVALAKDYDAGPDGTYDGTAITAPMKGTFEGLGHTISNFSAGGNGRYAGFFAGTSGDFTAIRDLTLSNAHVATSNQATE